MLLTQLSFPLLAVLLSPLTLAAAEESQPTQCEVDTGVEGVGILTIADGQTKSVRDSTGMAYVRYTCNVTAGTDPEGVSVRCPEDKQCVFPFAAPYVDDEYPCIHCLEIYKTKQPCEIMADGPCSDPISCLDNPDVMYWECCKFCRDGEGEGEDEDEGDDDDDGED